MENWTRNFKLLKQAKETGTLNGPFREYLLEKLGAAEMIQEWQESCPAEDAIEVFIDNQSGPDKTYVCQVCEKERPRVFSGTTWNLDADKPFGLCNGNCMTQWYGH